MTILPQSNIFSASADDIRELFGDYVDGPSACIAITMSARPLAADARNAIEKSLESFGYGPRSCTYTTLRPSSEEDGAGIALDPQALFLLVEGLDPVFVICADEATARQLEAAYRAPLSLDAAERLFGRPALVFRDFSSLMTTEDGKQRAWRLLKTLPKR